MSDLIFGGALLVGAVRPRMGHIGDNPQEVEFEPLTAPSVPEPVTAPATAPEEVPAGV